MSDSTCHAGAKLRGTASGSDAAPEAGTAHAGAACAQLPSSIAAVADGGTVQAQSAGEGLTALAACGVADSELQHAAAVTCTAVASEEAASERQEEEASAARRVCLAVTLEMDLGHIGDRGRFACDVEADVRRALGPAARDVAVLGLRAGSIVVELEVTVGCDVAGSKVYDMMLQQARVPCSPLRTGRYTAKTSGIQLSKLGQDIEAIEAQHSAPHTSKAERGTGRRIDRQDSRRLQTSRAAGKGKMPILRTSNSCGSISFSVDEMDGEEMEGEGGCAWQGEEQEGGVRGGEEVQSEGSEAMLALVPLPQLWAQEVNASLASV